MRRILLGLSAAGAMMAGGALAMPAVAAGNAHEAIVRSCIQQMFMSKAACSCLADQAASRLDPLQQQWLALGATDVGHSAPISKQMTHAEAVAIDHFMQSVPDACMERQATAG
jgi:hypothetical protein